MITLDRKRQPKAKETLKDKKAFLKVRKAETQYASKLRRIARHVGDLVVGIVEGEKLTTALARRVTIALDAYARMIAPWARATAARMLADVARRDEVAWSRLSQTISRELGRELRNAPTGHVFRASMERQVDLITSLPTEAAARVQRLATEQVVQGVRAKHLVAEVLRSGDVTRARATMIARTEVARVTTEITAARSQYAGSTHYIWRTSEDGDVRPSHRRMNGKVVAWNAPPTLDKLTGHAGALPNCRCYPEPILP